MQMLFPATTEGSTEFVIHSSRGRMVSPFAIVLVLLGLFADASVAQVDVCSATISNFYVTSRERIFNQTTRLLLSAFSDNPLGSEADLYQQLLMDLGLPDTPDRAQTFGRAFSQIIAANTRACTELQGLTITSANTTQVIAELRNALDSGHDLNLVRDIFGRALCLESLVETENVSFVTGLSGEDRGKIFGLAQRPYSLGFVVDDTGSMSDEIARVRQLITEFVNDDVGAPTHYILTSFNDPSKSLGNNNLKLHKHCVYSAIKLYRYILMLYGQWFMMQYFTVL